MRCHCDNVAVVATLIKTGDQQVSYGNETNRGPAGVLWQ